MTILLARHGMTFGYFEKEYRTILDYVGDNMLTMPSAEAQKADNILMRGAKNIGLFQAAALFYNFQTGGASDYSLINWVDPETHYALVVGSDMLFTVKAGWTCTGTGSYINTTWNPNSHGLGKFLQNDCAVALYSGTNVNADGNFIYGANSGSNRIISLNPRAASSNPTWRMNDGNNNTATAISNSVGTYIMRRNSSTDKRIWMQGDDGTVNVNDAVNVTSVGLPATVLHLFSISSNGTPGSYGVGRQLGKFVAFNSAAVPSNTSVSELFRHHHSLVSLL